MCSTVCANSIADGSTLLPCSRIGVVRSVSNSTRHSTKLTNRAMFRIQRILYKDKSFPPKLKIMNRELKIKSFFFVGRVLNKYAYF